MDENDCTFIIKTLQEWKESSSKNINKVLTTVNEHKNFKSEYLELILKTVTEFHRQIMKADKDTIEIKWYELCINAKKRLKKMVETYEKQKKKEPALEKKASSAPIEYPPELTAERTPNEEQLLKIIYKNFVSYFQEGLKDQRTVPFIIQLYKELKVKYSDAVDDSLKKKIQSICTRLNRESCRESKEKMLNGDIAARRLTTEDEEIYMDNKTKENIERIQREQIEKMQTGFYEQMKKRINKDACEECRFCRKKAAYCEDQKQIRASDEPMTRFMRCNACEKAWKD